VNLRVLDGSRLLRSSRLSLSRTIGAVFWLSSHGGSGVYPLSCEFDHPVGNPRSYVAWAELETWAGGGGVFLVSPAIASGNCTVERITVTLIR
jgi:hypothetical protein